MTIASAHGCLLPSKKVIISLNTKFSITYNIQYQFIITFLLLVNISMTELYITVFFKSFKSDSRNFTFVYHFLKI